MRKCPLCGKWFTGEKEGHVCPPPLEPRPCPICGKVFMPLKSSQICCSTACGKRREKKECSERVRKFREKAKETGEVRVCPVCGEKLPRAAPINWSVKRRHAGLSTRNGMTRPGTGALLRLQLSMERSVCLILTKGKCSILTGCIVSGEVCRGGPRILFWGSDMAIRCRHRIPSPEAVGFITAEALKEAAAQYPHLRPCPKYGWNWIYRTACKKCPNKVKVKLEGCKA